MSVGSREVLISGWVCYGQCIISIQRVGLAGSVQPLNPPLPVFQCDKPHIHPNILGRPRLPKQHVQVIHHRLALLIPPVDIHPPAERLEPVVRVLEQFDIPHELAQQRRQRRVAPGIQLRSVHARSKQGPDAAIACWPETNVAPVVQLGVALVVKLGDGPV